ncbi:MAG: DUF2946 family protein [Pseudomonadota bacterium]
MRRTTKRHIARLAIASLLVRVMLVAVFAPLLPSLTAANTPTVFDADGNQLVTVLCATHGSMTIPAADLGLGASTSDAETDAPISQQPVFCPFCLTLAADLPGLTSTAALWAPLAQPITHSRHRLSAPRTIQPQTSAQPRGPPRLPSSRV